MAVTKLFATPPSYLDQERMVAYWSGDNAMCDGSTAGCGFFSKEYVVRWNRRCNTITSSRSSGEAAWAGMVPAARKSE